MKLLKALTIPIMAALLSFSGIANAELIKILDFEELTDALGEGNWDSPLMVETSIPGLSVTLEVGTGFLYLDKGSGLGNCQSDTGCAKNPDDNFNIGETFTFTFMVGDEVFVPLGATLQAVAHEEEGFFAGSLADMSDGGEWALDDSTIYTFAEGESFSMTVTAGEFYIAALWIDDGLLPPQAVPEPANLALMALGLLGLVASRRKFGR
ncbi:PEP-CTERM sorting domain-containing protein [Thalassotalea mangrovi]|uniref:PEP-CTERM sorting domain-containing protein n=1 Tax=Thalassotalea mangrovi TaxID=2572245 RepID=A0A4U1B586_9GAMM|nr:PEP-CTERM sorting domain-containing protein [Thalassotalea mangrovi]TKB44698.1 PEP-CTERM sorting domain-containing protein [Thalassotalea mangrovi]